MDWSFEQLMYIDESAFNERSLDRNFGWAEVGAPARQIESFKRSKKWSILPLYTCDGFLDWKIIHGSFNADLFVQFLEEHVIPHTTPYPGPRSVLIMDNCKIHHDEVSDIPCILQVDIADDSASLRSAIERGSYSRIFLHTRQT